MFGLPFFLLSLKASAFLVTTSVSLLTFHLTLQSYLFLFFAIEGVSFGVVTSRAERFRHTIKFDLLRGGDAMCIGRLQFLGIGKHGVDGCVQLLAQSLDLFFNFVFLHAEHTFRDMIRVDEEGNAPSVFQLDSQLQTFNLDSPLLFVL